ncbi:MAG: hypothetical protein RIT81_18790 [Deltaproteobacteria bacterium]
MTLLIPLLGIVAAVAGFTKLRPGPAGPLFVVWGVGSAVVGAAWPTVFMNVEPSLIHVAIVAFNLAQALLTVVLAIGLVLIPATLQRQRKDTWHSSP